MADEQDKYSFWLTACKLPDGKAHLPLAPQGDILPNEMW